MINAVGSSPRVRGTFDYILKAKEQHGIIPACAGNIELRLPTYLPAQDHPRVCGEHRRSY